MLRLAAELKKRKLAQTNWSSSSCNSRNVNRREEERRSFFDVDDLVLLDILRRLPVESLLKFRSVCRRWRCLIKADEHFRRLHFTSSEARLQRDENTFLIYPTCRYTGAIPIKRLFFSQKDLRRFDDSQGHGILDCAVVTRDNVTLDQENQPILMLEPAHGLVCFVNGGGKFQHCSIQIYNPSTRQKTPWIETSTSPVFRNIHGVLPKEDSQGRLLECIMCFEFKYSFGFGIDRTTNQHKVLGMYGSTLGRLGDVDFHELVCGVLTVGENIWRKIDQVPPEIAIGENIVHVCGSLYWMSDHEAWRSPSRVIMVFDLACETFRSIVIPDFILGLWESTPLIHKLAEVDGRLALLVREGDNMLNLWIYNVENASKAAGGGNWIKETMQLPFRWDGIYNLAFKCIAGSSLVVIKFLKERRKCDEFPCEYLQVYDRREKKYYANQFSVLLEPTGAYSIAPFDGTLLPLLDYSA